LTPANSPRGGLFGAGHNFMQPAGAFEQLAGTRAVGPPTRPSRSIKSIKCAARPYRYAAAAAAATSKPCEFEDQPHGIVEHGSFFVGIGIGNRRRWRARPWRFEDPSTSTRPGLLLPEGDHGGGFLFAYVGRMQAREAAGSRRQEEHVARPKSDSAPLVSRCLESTLVASRKLMRVGMLALMRPVMNVDCWAAAWPDQVMPTARAICARRVIDSSTLARSSIISRPARR